MMHSLKSHSPLQIIALNFVLHKFQSLLWRCSCEVSGFAVCGQSADLSLAVQLEDWKPQQWCPTHKAPFVPDVVCPIKAKTNAFYGLQLYSSPASPQLKRIQTLQLADKAINLCHMQDGRARTNGVTSETRSTGPLTVYNTQ